MRSSARWELITTPSSPNTTRCHSTWLRPLSTFDLQHSAEDIEVEERSPEELQSLGGCRLAPEGVEICNPAFDVTPLELVSALITEKGVFRPPLMPPV